MIQNKAENDSENSMAQNLHENHRSMGHEQIDGECMQTEGNEWL